MAENMNDMMESVNGVFWNKWTKFAWIDACKEAEG